MYKEHSLELEKVSFDEKLLHNLYIKLKLDQAESSASNPETKWIDEDTFWSNIEARL